MRDRGRRNTNERGSSANRRARRLWLLTPEAGFGGDGITVPCSEPDCIVVLTVETLFVDRIVPGSAGGRYTRDNIKPHCRSCSCRQGQKMTVKLRRSHVAVDL